MRKNKEKMRRTRTRRRRKRYKSKVIWSTAVAKKSGLKHKEGKCTKAKLVE